jgi:GT2 family glycosyltransferase
MKPKVAIIILNWNGWKKTIRSLESVYQIDYPNYDLVVVDNASSDDSVEKIRDYCNGTIESKFLSNEQINKPIKLFEYNERDFVHYKNDLKELLNLPSKEKIILLKTNKNCGFAGGNNIGMKYALDHLSPKYILLLNNDTVVESKFLTELVNVSEKDKNIGSVQSLLLRPEGKIIDSLGQELLDWGAKDKCIGEEYTEVKKTEIFGACAASALYKSDVLRNVGLFDESFFMIFEDVDLSWRIRISGKSSILVPKSIVYHMRGLSGEKKSSIAKNYLIKKNWLIIALRYYPLNINKEFLSRLRDTFILALKTGKFQEFLKIFTKNIFTRIFTKNDPSLKELQKKWINKCS